MTEKSAETTAHESMSKTVKIKIALINRFVARTGKNTRQAIPVLANGGTVGEGNQEETCPGGYVYFHSELSPDVLAARNDPPEEGKTKPDFVGIDKAHPYGIVLYDMAVGPNANEKSKKYYVWLFRTFEQAIYSIGQSIYRINQRDDIEVVQDEEGYRLVDGFIRLVGCTMRDIIAEIAGNKPWGTIKAKIVEETDQSDLEDISVHKNVMRKEMPKSDLARRMYEMSIVGREEEAGADGEESTDGKKGRRKAKRGISDTQIADRLGLPKDGGRAKVLQFRTVYEWCLKQGEKGQSYLERWDAGKLTLKELLSKAQGKSGSEGANEPRDRKKTRPRCLSYPAAYKLYSSDAALAAAVEKLAPEVPLETRLALVREGLKIAMQQQDKQVPEVPANLPTEKQSKSKKKGEQTEPPVENKDSTPPAQEASATAPTDAA